MKVMVTLYDRAKTDDEATIIAEVVYEGVTNIDTVRREQFSDGVLDGMCGDLDPMGEYTRLQFDDLTHSVFRNSYASVKRIA